jgi:hypothetical protein
MARSTAPGQKAGPRYRVSRGQDKKRQLYLALGVNIAWYPGFSHAVTWAALWDFMTDFQTRGTKAWDDFVASRRDRPYPTPEAPPDRESDAKRQELEHRYFGSQSGGG